MIVILTDPPPGLNCSNCLASNEADCTASQEIVQCDPGFVCFTQEAFNSHLNSLNFSRGCFPEFFCDVACASLNESLGGVLSSCMTECCNTSGCNVGSLPTTETLTTTEVTPTTTEAPTRTMAPPTTMAPTPTTPLGKETE